MVADNQHVVIQYAPRKAFIPYHDRVNRWSVIVAHRRCGKTVACINELIVRAMLDAKSDGRYAYIAPLFNQAKDVAWAYLKRYAAPVLSGLPNETELRIDLVNGARIRLYGADNPDRLRGIYMDGVILDEYADMDPSIWGEVIRPLLADRKGWATFIGTPKGRNQFYDMFARGETDENWFSLKLRASETGILDAQELIEAQRDMTPEQYEQEFECSFEAAILGAYYGREMSEAERQGRLQPNLKRIDGPVHCAWDFGNGANMAIWAFQVSGDTLLVHDFIQLNGYYFEDYLKEVNKRGYTGFDYVPHDAKVPSFETGRTRIETLRGFNRRPVLIADHKVDDRINAAQLTLRRTYFNAETCAAGLEALRQYRQDWDSKARVFKKVPLHNWASHPADAFGYMAMAWREIIAPTAAPPAPLKHLGNLTIEELWRATPQERNFI